MKKRLKPRRARANEVDRKIKEDVNRKYAFLIERKGCIQFTPPPKDWLNSMFAHHEPQVFLTSEGKISLTAKGEMGYPRIYYIPGGMFKKLTQTFDEFEIPAEHRDNLIWAFLNMVFASCMAVHSNNIHRGLREDDRDFIEFMELLTQFESNTKILRGFTIVFQDRNKHCTEEGKYVLGDKGSRTFGIGRANGFMEELLQNFKNYPNYDQTKWYYDLLKRTKKESGFHGHKNYEKEQQSYYAWAVFEFLREVLFRPALEFHADNKKYNAKLRELKKKYSRRNRFIFVGRFLALSGLLYEKEEFDDEDLFDIIRKKLENGLRAERKRHAEMRRHNSTSQDDKIYILPYSSQF